MPAITEVLTELAEHALSGMAGANKSDLLAKIEDFGKRLVTHGVYEPDPEPEPETAPAAAAASPDLQAQITQLQEALDALQAAPKPA